MRDKPLSSIGISSLSYPWAVGVSRGPTRQKRRLTVLDLVEKARTLGVGHLQIAENLPLENLPWETVVKLKRVAEEYSIRMEVGTMGTDRKHLIKFLEISRFLKSPVLRLVPSFLDRPADLNALENDLGNVLEDYEREGITIVLENQPDHPAEQYAGLLKRVDRPNLKICLNPANALGALEGPGYAMEKLGPFCGSLHINDVAVVRSQYSMGFHVEGRPAGKGKVPVQWVLEKLRGYGARHSTTIGLWPPWQGDIESTVRLEENWVAESLEFLRSLN